MAPLNCAVAGRKRPDLVGNPAPAHAGRRTGGLVMKECRRQKPRGGTLVLKKTDESLRRRVREIGGDRVGVVPVDVAKKRVCAMVTDFYGSVLCPPEVFPVTAAGLNALQQRISTAQQDHGLKEVVIGLEQTGRLHEPVRRVLGKRWTVKLVHPLVTNHLRQGLSRNVKTEAMDVDALFRAVAGGYGSPCTPMPVAYERWRALHRAREQLVDDRSALKLRMHERLHAVLPGFSAQFANLWTSPTALALIDGFDGPDGIRALGEPALLRWLCEHGAACTRAKAESLLAWASDSVPPTAAATTEAAILRADLEHLALLGRRIEWCERQLLQFLVQTPFVLLLSVPGISHVLSSGLGAEAGPMSFYPTARNLTGRAGLYPRRYQSDETDLQDHTMARGEPFLRDVLMKIGRCLVRSQGAFFAWGESRRTLGWCEKEIVAAMANRFCRIAHAMLLAGQTFRHADAKPGVSVLGKLLNVAADLGLDAATATELAIAAAARIPAPSRETEIQELQTGAWKIDHRPREHGASPGTTRPITQQTVPALLTWLKDPENNHDVAPLNPFRSP